MSRPSPAWLAKAAAAVVSVGVLAFGAKAISNTDSPSPASAAGVPTAASTPAGGSGVRPPAPNGAGMPGMGAEVTGSTLDRLESVVTAKYPGTVERAMRLPDGSYVVHVIRSSGSEAHVRVSTDFRITGTEQRPPRGDDGRMGPRDDDMPPARGSTAES